MGIRKLPEEAPSGRVFGPGIQKSRPSLIGAPFLSNDLIDDVSREMVTLKIVCPKLVQAGSQRQQNFISNINTNAVLSSSGKLQTLLQYRSCDYRLVMWSQYMPGHRIYSKATVNALGTPPTKSACRRLNWHMGQRAWQAFIQRMNEHQRIPPQPVNALGSLISQVPKDHRVLQDHIGHHMST